jgi:hypothetical protein
MANNLGVNATNILSDIPSEKAGLGEQGGRKRVIYDKFTLTADLSSADTIQMGGLIPAGALVHNVHLVFDAMGAGTLDVGWEVSADGGELADADGFLNEAAVTSAGHEAMLEDHPTVAGVFKRFSEAVQPVITVSVDTTATSGDIELLIEYSVA